MKNLVKFKIRSKFYLGQEQIDSEINGWLKARGKIEATIELEVVGTRKITALNRKFMGHDYPTDVLSFPLDAIPGEKDKLVGTVVICDDVLRRQAHKKGNSPEEEFVFLLRHGIDHLLGIHHD